jgi:hypothetical protein
MNVVIDRDFLVYSVPNYLRLAYPNEALNRHEGYSIHPHKDYQPRGNR